MCTLQTGKLCYNAIKISITSLCLCMCRIARELNLSSVMVLRKGLCGLFIPQKLRSAVHRISQQSYESYIVLRVRIVVGVVKSLNQGLWLHNRIHVTPKQTFLSTFEGNVDLL